MSALSSAAFALVRGWTRLYTCRLPEDMRQARRLEIESDLWESRCDSTGVPDARLAAQVLLRLVLGIPDDLQWRVETFFALHRLHDAARIRAVIAVAAGALLLVGAWAATVAPDPPVQPDRADPRVFVVGPRSQPFPPPPPPSPTASDPQ